MPACLRSGEVVLLQDTGRDRRWETYCATAAGLGVCSSLSVPLGAHGHAPGALNLYAGRPAAFGDREIGRATAFGPQRPGRWGSPYGRRPRGS